MAAVFLWRHGISIVKGQWQGSTDGVEEGGARDGEYLKEGRASRVEKVKCEVPATLAARLMGSQQAKVMSRYVKSQAGVIPDDK